MHLVGFIIRIYHDARSAERQNEYINTLHAELNPICQLLALLEAHYILYVSRIKVNIHSYINT